MFDLRPSLPPVPKGDNTFFFTSGSHPAAEGTHIHPEHSRVLSLPIEFVNITFLEIKRS